MLRSPFRGAEPLAILIVGVAAGLLAVLMRDPYLQLVFSTVPIWATVALSWNMFSGYTGLISFGHATFFGLGAFTVALLELRLGVSPWLGIPAGAAVGALASLLIGAVTFRLRGHYFALAMLAYPALFVFLFDWMGWQELTLSAPPDHPWRAMQFADPRVDTALAVVLMAATMAGTLVLQRSRLGLAMLAIKGNETAAETSGIDAFRVKMTGFVISGALGALAGGFYAVVLQVVTPGGVFGTLVSAQALILALFGGIGTLWGPVIGAAVLVPLTELLRAELGSVLPGIQGVIYGLVVVAVILAAPEGVFWRVRDLRARRRPVAAPDTLLPASPPPPCPQDTAAKGVVLSVRGLSKSFGGLKAVQDVTFDVQAGEILGIIGPNGAGKTTLFNLLNGLQRADSGRVEVAGADVTGLRPHARCRRGVGRTFQVARPFARMSVLDNVVVGALATTASGPAASAAARDALRLAGLERREGASVAMLTNLELRLLELARALAARPRVLLLDETLAGLGAREVEAILPVIAGLPRAGVTVVIIEHTMHAMLRLAGRFVVIDHGQVIATGAPREVMAQRQVVEAYLGKRWAQMHAHA